MELKSILDLAKESGPNVNVNYKILSLLTEGMTKTEISDYLKKEGYQPNSLSMIDKKIKAFKVQTKTKTLFQLMYKLGEKNSSKKND